MLLQSTIMIAYSALVLKVNWGGSVGTVLLTMFLSALAIAAIGMLIGIITLIANNFKVANAFEFGVIYIMALIGGGVSYQLKLYQRLSVSLASYLLMDMPLRCI